MALYALSIFEDLVIDISSWKYIYGVSITYETGIQDWEVQLILGEQ